MHTATREFRGNAAAAVVAVVAAAAAAAAGTAWSLVLFHRIGACAK